MKKKNTIQNYIFIIPPHPKNSRKKLLRKYEANKIYDAQIVQNAQNPAAKCGIDKTTLLCYNRKK